MKRRNFIASAAIVATAGCSELSSLTGPKYEDVSEQEMYLDESDFPDDWQEFPELNEELVIYGTDEEGIYVGQDVALFESTEAAKTEFNRQRQSHADENDYTLGDEAFWVLTEDKFAMFFLRDSNALGQVLGIKQSGFEVVPDRQRAIRYAEDLHEHWQTFA